MSNPADFQRKTFLHPSVCKHALVWECPSQMLIDTRKAQPSRLCKLDHDPYYRKQFHDALEQYRLQRAKAEPQWGASALIDGDPWGFSFDCLLAIEDEIHYVEEQRNKHLQRPDVFNTDLAVNDDNYSVIHQQIKELYHESNKMLDENSIDVQPPQLDHVLATIQSLEEARNTALLELVRDQCAVITHYFNRRREIERELIEKGLIVKSNESSTSINQYPPNSSTHYHENSMNDADSTVDFTVDHPAQTPNEISSLLEQRLPLPPNVIDIQQFTDIKLDFRHPTAQFYDQHLADLGTTILHAVRGYKLQVCDTCCGLLNLQDELQRLSLHICGKVHFTFKQLRFQLEKYRNTIKPLAFQHNNPRLIHPWVKWTQTFTPRSEYEIMMEAKQRQRSQYNAQVFEFFTDSLGLSAGVTHYASCLYNNNTGSSQLLDPFNVIDRAVLIKSANSEQSGPNSGNNSNTGNMMGNPGPLDGPRRLGFREEFHLSEHEAFGRGAQSNVGNRRDDRNRDYGGPDGYRDRPQEYRPHRRY